MNTYCDCRCAGVIYPTSRAAMRYERSPPAISTVADTHTSARMIQALKPAFPALVRYSCSLSLTNPADIRLLY